MVPEMTTANPATIELEVSREEAAVLVEGLKALRNCRRFAFRDERSDDSVESLTLIEALAARLRTRRRTSQRAEPVGPLAQQRLAASMEAATPLRLREYVDARVQGDHLTSRAGTVPVADAPPEVLGRLLAGQTLRADDLGLTLARALVEAGVVVAG